MSIFNRRGRVEPMPDRFVELARYNSRVGQGVVHEEGYVARMAALQLDFDVWQAESWRRSRDASRTIARCGVCSQTWMMSDPELAIMRERPVLRCADTQACAERVAQREQGGAQ